MSCAAHRVVVVAATARGGGGGGARASSNRPSPRSTSAWIGGKVRGAGEPRGVVLRHDGARIVRFAERDELDAVAALQSEAFYEPLLAPALGMTVIDAPVRAYFEYDVRQTLERKYFPYAAQGRFAPLVIDAGENDVVGVVEISVQRDFECMRALEDVEGLAKTHEYAYLSCMAVDASARRRGLATALIAGGEVIAREWGFNLLTLHVFAENVDALRVYERAGYTVLDRPFRTPLDVAKNRRKLYMAKRL